MTSYEIKPSAKTRVLNTFRRIFTVPAFERMLVSQVVNGRSSFLQKLIPPDYLYPLGTKRQTTRNGIQFDLDISHDSSFPSPNSDIRSPGQPPAGRVRAVVRTSSALPVGDLFVEVTGNELPRAELAKLWNLTFATIESERAPGPEPATARRVGR